MVQIWLMAEIVKVRLNVQVSSCHLVETGNCLENLLLNSPLSVCPRAHEVTNVAYHHLHGMNGNFSPLNVCEALWVTCVYLYPLLLRLLVPDVES